MTTAVEIIRKAGGYRNKRELSNKLYNFLAPLKRVHLLAQANFFKSDESEDILIKKGEMLEVDMLLAVKGNIRKCYVRFKKIPDWRLPIKYFKVVK